MLLSPFSFKLFRFLLGFIYKFNHVDINLNPKAYTASYH